MATVSTVIFLKDQKKDGTWNVKIRISNKSKHAFIETKHFVGAKQIKAKGKGAILKDTFVIDRIAPQLKKYRDWVSDNAELLDQLSVGEIKQMLVNLDGAAESIDFLFFVKEFIEFKIEIGKAQSARSLKTVFYSLSEYHKGVTLPIALINYDFLKNYERYLRSPRVLKRPTNNGGLIEVKVNGLTDAGLYTHMRDFRLLFNEARNKYNDEDLGLIRIKNYPFKKYKVGSPPITEHRDRPVSEIIAIRDAELPKDSRAELARDLGMLSLYLLGMNAGDLYELKKGDYNRVDYNRSKTRGKRKDKAFISVKVIDEAKPLLKKYAGKLQERYSSKQTLNKAIDKGLAKVSEIVGIPDIDFYDFRHCVGSWARNLCNFPIDDVAQALNHKERTVTDIYISPDWNKIDEVQKAVVNLLKAQDAE